MSGLLANRGGFHAQGTEIHGKGVSEEQATVGTIVVANGTSGTPAAIQTAVAKAVAAKQSPNGLTR